MEAGRKELDLLLDIFDALFLAWMNSNPATVVMVEVFRSKTFRPEQNEAILGKVFVFEVSTTLHQPATLGPAQNPNRWKKNSPEKTTRLRVETFGNAFIILCFRHTMQTLFCQLHQLPAAELTLLIPITIPSEFVPKRLLMVKHFHSPRQQIIAGAVRPQQGTIPSNMVWLFGGGVASRFSAFSQGLLLLP